MFWDGPGVVCVVIKLSYHSAFMASGSSAPKIPAICMALGDIIHILGRHRCGLCCVKLKLS